jgi:hypothetical protein
VTVVDEVAKATVKVADFAVTEVLPRVIDAHIDKANEALSSSDLSVDQREKLEDIRDRATDLRG